jgi:hypothetical protein
MPHQPSVIAGLLTNVTPMTQVLLSQRRILDHTTSEERRENANMVRMMDFAAALEARIRKLGASLPSWTLPKE